MSRLESIKERLNDVNREGIAWKYNEVNEEIIDQNNDYEFNRVVDDIDPIRGEFIANSPADIEYLLQRLERYETALKEVRVSTSHNHARFVADKAMKEGN